MIIRIEFNLTYYFRSYTSNVLKFPKVFRDNSKNMCMLSQYVRENKKHCIYHRSYILP